MDMPITALNVLGNTLAPLVISKWEGKFSEERHQQALLNIKQTSHHVANNSSES